MGGQTHVLAAQVGAHRNCHHKLGRFNTFTTRARNAGVGITSDDPAALSALAKELAADVKQQERRTGLRLVMWKVWIFFEDPASSKPAKVMSFLMMATIITSILNFCLETIPDCEYIDHETLGRTYACRERQENASPWYEIEFVCIMIFTVEFVLRLLASPEGERRRGGLWAFCKNGANIIDIVAIIPWYIERAGNEAPSFLSLLRIIRASHATSGITRIARIFKMSKNIQGMVVLARTMKKSVSALAMLGFLVVISLVFFSTFIYFLEGPRVGSRYEPLRKQWVRADGSPTPFESIFFSMWWCLVTMTTVGYGDHYPITAVGQLIAMLVMFWGLVVLSLPITIVGANFDEEYREMKRKGKEEKVQSELGRARERESQAAQQKEQKEQRERLLLEAGEAADDEGEVGEAGGKGDEPTPTKKSRGGGLGGSLLRRSRGKDEDQPTKRIARLVHESNLELAAKVRRLMVKHECELRREIRKVLVKHGHGCDQPTPLEAAVDRLVGIEGPVGACMTTAPEEQSIGGLVSQLRRSSGHASGRASGGDPDAAGSLGADGGGAAGAHGSPGTLVEQLPSLSEADEGPGS